MIEIVTQRSPDACGAWFHRCATRSPMFLRWVLAAAMACLSLRLSASESVVEAVRTYAVGVDLLDLQDPPKVFAAEVSDSRILDITEVRVGLNLVGGSPGSGFASEMFVSLNKDFSATAVLLNKVGVTLANGAGFGYDGWDVTFGDQATLGDVHTLDWPSGVLTGEVQPDGRLVPESSARPARLDVFNGSVANGTWRLSVADLHLGGTMRLKSWSLTLVGKTNRAPVFVGLSDVTIPETAEHRMTLGVRDSDLPAQSLTVALVEGPVGAVVSGGEFRWNPPETAGGTTNLVRVSVSDGVDATTNSFRVVVTESNQPPVFGAFPEVILTDLSPYSLRLSATDADVPTQSLTYALVGGPEGAEVVGDTFHWEPFEEQRPSTNVVRISVSDGVVTVTNQFVMKLPAVNTAPKLSAIADRTLREGVALGFNLQAVDSDVPVNALTYGLVDGPPGLVVSAAGRVSWVPSEAQGPGTYSVTVKVEDDGYPMLGDSVTFQLTVNEVNLPPEIEVPANRDQNEGEPLTLLLRATDLDLPAQAVAFSLVSGPTGLTVSLAGLLEWTPTELQGPSRQVVRVRATDSIGAAAEAEFTVNVLEVANPPVLPALGPFSIHEMVAWSQALGGSDPDLPEQTISYTLVSGPTGLGLTPEGRLVWTPTEAQGPGSYTAVVRLSDETGLSTERSYPITVSEVNRVPVLATVSSQSVGEGSLLSVQLGGSDADLPTNKLTYALVQGPTGMRVDPTSGRLEWTPSEVQGPSTNTVVVSVSDDAGTPLSFQTSFRVTVSEVNQPPSLASIDDQPVTEGQALIVQLTGSDPDFPANTLRYRLVSPPSGMRVDAATGGITWTPTTDQGPATYTVTAEVYDDADPPLSGRRSFQVIVTDSNRAPVANAQAVSGTEEVSLSIRLAATDADGDPLTYSIVSRPTKGTLAGFPPNLTYVPTVNAFGSDSFTFKANDGTVDSVPATVSIMLARVDDPPVVQGGRITLAEDTPTEVLLSASDSDGDPLSYTIVSAPQRGTLSGTPPNLTYTPFADVSGPDQISFKVTDGRTESGVAIINLTITAVNDPPVIAAFPEPTIDEGSSLAIDLIATDVDLPAQPISFSLVSGPRGLSISASGRVSWTPQEDQGPATNAVTVRATDGIAFGDRTFQVVVREVNQPPVMVAISDSSVPEGDLLSIDLVGTDSDLPVQSLSFSLVSGPSGMSVSPSGRLTWVPASSQALMSHRVTVRVSDGALTGEGTFRVAVTERIVRIPPVFVGLTNAVIPEGLLYRQSLRGRDEAGRTTGLTFRLVEGPVGASVEEDQFQWTPTEAQGPFNQAVRVAVSDGRLSATNNFQITVTEVNSSPTWPGLPDVRVREGDSYSLRLRAIDADLPEQPIRYLLLEGPDGSRMDSDGLFTWSPTERQGPSTNLVRVSVTDGQSEASSAFRLIVDEVNQPPTLVGSGDFRITEKVPWSLVLLATDPDVPAQSLSFRWVSGPPGSGVTNGVFSWVSPAVTVDTAFPVAVAVGDGIESVTNRFTVTVVRSTGAPSFVGLANAVIPEGTAYQQALRATHPQLPESRLSFRWISGPGGSTVEGGVFRWTPGEAQGPSTNVVRVAVSDGTLAVTNAFTLLVEEVNQPPVFKGLTNAVIPEMVAYSQAMTVNDADIPQQTLNLRLVTAPDGARLVDGRFVWTPTEAQGPATHVVRVAVSDGVQSVTNAFAVTVSEVPTPPSLSGMTPQSIPESTPFLWVIPGVDSDLPAQTLTYRLLEGPVGAVLTNGVFAWTPDENAGGTASTVRIAVTDGESSVTNIVLLTVTEVNQAPVPVPLGTRRVNEGNLLTFPVGGTDGDLPPQRLTHTLVTGPQGLTVSSNGVVTWRPTEAQGPSTNLVLIRVTDDGQPALSATNAIEVVVREVNTPPVQVPAGLRRVSEGNLITFTLGATDGDLPPQRLTHLLIQGPEGLTVSSSGVVDWRPTEAQGPSTNTILVRVTDDGSPALSATNAFEIVVREVNTPPIPVPSVARRVSEGNPISFTVGAKDTDLPAQRLTFALILGPVGLTVSSNGVVNWRPSEAQGPSTNTVLVRVTDDGAPAQSATNAVEIVVREVNAAPVLDAVTDRVVKLPGSVVLVLKASDADLPIQPLTYRLVSGPAGMTVGVDGSLRWTPTEAQARSTNGVTVSVSDGVVNMTTAFKVVVEASPRLSLQVTGGASVTIQVAGPSGALCRLEQADSPLGPWTAVSGVADIATQGFGTPLAVIVPGPLQAGRLYRLRVL